MKKKYSFVNPLISNSVDIDQYQDKSKDTKPEPTTLPSSPLPQPKDEWVSAPDYRLPDGSINPQYKSTRAQSAATGARYGASIRTGNPMFDIGAILGGLLGGVTHKDLAGKERYYKSIQEANTLNETTQAHQRIIAQQQQLQLQADKEKRLLDNSIFVQNLKEAQAKTKNLTDSTKSLINFAKSSPTPELREEINSKLNKLWDIDADPSEDFGESFEAKSYGDHVFLFNKHTGEFKGAKTSDGQDINPLSTPQQVSALKSWMSLSEKDAPTMEEALNKADDYISKNFKGGLKPTQYNSLKMQLAREIIQNKDTKSDSGKVIINGQVIPTPNLPILGQMATIESQAQSESQPEVDMTQYQGLPMDIAQWASGIPKESINSLKSVYQDGLKAPKDSPQYQDSTNRMDALSRREKQLTGNPQINTEQSTDLPKGVKPDTKYLQPNGTYIMWSTKEKAWVRFSKKK